MVHIEAMIYIQPLAPHNALHNLTTMHQSAKGLHGYGRVVAEKFPNIRYEHVICIARIVYIR